MKILVYQVEIGNGAYSYQRKIDNYVGKICRPSVKRYCEKYGYDYNLITSFPDLDVDWYHDIRFPDRIIKSTLIRYYYMHQDQYDAVVSLDNDIFVTPTAEQLPQINGHMGIASSHIAGRLGEYPMINGGVQMIDKNTGLIIKNYIKRICELKVLPPNTFFSDQYYINKLRINRPDIAYLLEPKWNWIVKEHLDESYEGVNFIHYCSSPGRTRLEKDLMQKNILF